MFSYHNDPEKTKRAYNAKGWSTLGDVGYLDDEGFLYLTDRKSYMIISGGVNIYPQETEDVLITHPGVADVAVFGVPNEEMGEEVKAVVQPHDMARAGKELEAELIVFCRKHLSPIKCPRSIDFEAELPRTPTGKLVKRHLRDRYWPKQRRRRRHVRRSALCGRSVPQLECRADGGRYPRMCDPQPSRNEHPRSFDPPSPHSGRVGRYGMNAMTTLPDIPLPATIRSRFVDDINGLRMHVLEAGFETKRPALPAAAARLSRTRL